MKNIYLVLIPLLIFLVTVEIFAGEKVLVRIETPDNYAVNKFLNGIYDVTSYIPGKYIDLVIPKESLDGLSKEFTSIKIIQTEDQIRDNLKIKKDVTGYRTYEQTVLELQQFESDNPNICKLYDIGDSWGKTYLDSGYTEYSIFDHDIWAMKISDNVETEEDEPSFYIFGIHHARELPTTEVAMGILNDLINNYGTDPDAQRRIDNSQIWFIPIMNPDGHKMVTSEFDVWWRKNIRDNNFSHTFPDTLEGVDPNRNYGFWWGDNSTSEDPESYNYRGPEPWSEPEIQAIRNLLDSHHFVGGISYHCYGQGVLYPFAYDFNAIPHDKLSLYELGRNIAESIITLSGTYNYLYQSINTGGANMGLLEDYAYGQHGIFAYLIEMGTEFIPPYSVVQENILPNNLSGAYVLLDRANSSLLTGHISDQITKSPVVAVISVENVDGTGTFKEPYKSDLMYGRYYRFLEPGSYNVTFSAYGYIPVIVPLVSVTSTGITELNISLTPSTPANISGTVSDKDTGLPVDSACIEIYENIKTFTDQSGSYSIDNIPYNSYEFKISSENYITQYVPLTIDGTSNAFNFQLAFGNIEDFETHDFSKYRWSTGGDTDWFISSFEPFRGDFYARSGWLNENGTYDCISELILNESIVSDGNISFLYKLSDFQIGDSLIFRIDNDRIANLKDGRWTQKSFPITAGDHTFSWIFYKGSSWEYQTDHCACLDNIVLPGIFPAGTIETDNAVLSSDCDLYQNYPNPFNNSTAISFYIKRSDNVRLSIYNAKGEFIFNLINRKIEKGSHKITFDGRNLNSGIYFACLETGNSRVAQTMLLLK